MKMSFEFEVEEINVILAGLSKLPLETSGLVFQSVKSQADPQFEKLMRDKKEGLTERKLKK